MRELPLELSGPRLFELARFSDERGSFIETWHQERFASVGITDNWVQDNQSISRRQVLRGMHYQIKPGQAKLVRVAIGHAFDVVVDVRRASPSFGRWAAFELRPDPARAVYIPPGFAHGFCALEEGTQLLYKVSTPYDPTAELGLAWNDVDVAIDWPIADPILSPRDRTLPTLADVAALTG